ncbi:uncharacterized protein LOC122383728 [Amphibalanus amphitrite]|uniref:uncharacterized protein LOC122383728 n=1 Tax=Amphibalanus amphitrite TaxID=1232801 RepID=UPI001C90C8D7|nr:uncharacterized protein LOC122383728 [Amphibalanus amphitrite]
MPERKPGGQPVLTSQEEADITLIINQLAEWKVPLSEIDIRLLVKNYLDRQGKLTRFKNNMPGPDWMKLFMRRNNLTARAAENVKPSRAGVTAAEIQGFFSRLAQVLEGVEPQNLFNYDETNVTDDPGAKRCITRRGMRRVERRMSHSKQATSIMFCGSADGKYLPPMVVYKAKHIYQEWMQGGPTGALYHRSPSGWFDNFLFERWFFDLFLPHVKDRPGKKVLLGDNLASHFSIPVLEACKENKIEFVSLVPNATHLLQPLDVGVFGPAKRVWRRILENWRKEARSRQSIPKTSFPGLLKKLCSKMPGANLKAGFKGCGILPLDPAQVLKHLPGTSDDQDSRSLLSESVTSLLQEHILPGTAEKTQKKRGPKVQPGAAVVASDLSTPSTSEVKQQQTPKPKTAPKRAFTVLSCDDTSECEDNPDEENEKTDTDAEDEESCSICFSWNIPGQRQRQIDWEGCEKCGKWYHSHCIKRVMKDKEAVVEDFCNCS